MSQESQERKPRCPIFASLAFVSGAKCLGDLHAIDSARVQNVSADYYRGSRKSGYQTCNPEDILLMGGVGLAHTRCPTS